MAHSRKWGQNRFRREAVLVPLGSPSHTVVLKMWSPDQQAQHPGEPVRNAGAQARPQTPAPETLGAGPALPALLLFTQG